MRMASAFPRSSAFGLRPGAAPPAAHGTVPIRRGMLVAGGAGIALLAAWAAGATWCLVQSDTLSAGFLARQSAIQNAYEDRIEDLRSRLDRAATQKLVEQEGLEGRLRELAARQARIEARQAVVGRLAAEAGLAAPASASPAPDLADDLGTASAFAPRAPKPLPVPETFGLRTGGLADPAGAPPAMPPGRLERTPQGTAHERVSRLDRSLKIVEAAQLKAIDAVRRRSESLAARLRLAIEATGLEPERLEGPLARGGVGGPFVPLPSPSRGDAFDVAAAQAQASLIQLARLRQASAALPLGRPTGGEADLTSGFGMRIDPFTRGPAMHTGLDFKADHGAQARATAGGTVVMAEYSGGYGRMVEIDHGHGLSTRYAHLSSIAVAPGQSVRAGTIIGRVGSTGRSTGAHLHYETRIDGVPVDPRRFLRAGARLRGAAVAALP
jgi:murein DD-endopeptidase MepM/ murein hydrolase activator NlpD